MPLINLSLFGPLVVEYDGAALKLDTRKTVALLIYLAVTRRSHRRDSLVDLLWPKSGHAGGRKLLRGSLHVLRRNLGSSFFQADRENVALALDSDVRVDVDRFHDLLDACERDGYQLLVSTDQNLKYQQKISDRSLSFIILLSTSWPRIVLRVDDVKAAIGRVSPGEYIEIPI